MNVLKKNFLYNISYQILMIVIPIITLPYVSRTLGVENIGLYSYCFSIASYFGIFIMLGNSNYGNRSIAATLKEKKLLSKSFWGVYFIQFFFGVFVFCLYIIYCVFYAENYSVSLIQSIYLVSIVLDISWFFYGLEEFKVAIFRNVIVKILTIFAIFFFVQNKNDLYAYSFIMSLSALFSQLILWIFIKKYIYIIFPSRKELIIHAKSTLLLFVPVVAISLYTIVSKILLGSLSTFDEVGYFDNSSKLIAIPSVVMVSLGTVMLPRISSLVASGDNKLSLRYLHISFLLSIFLSVSMSLGFIGIVKEFVPLFFGEGFEKCNILIPILILSSIFVSWANVIRTQYLIPNNKDKAYIFSVILGAVVNIIVNFILIPLYGSIGAAIATLLTEIVVCVFQTCVVKSEIDIGKYIRQSIFFVLMGVIMCMILLNIPNYYSDIITIIIKIFLGMIIYIIPCYIYFRFYLQKCLIN